MATSRACFTNDETNRILEIAAHPRAGYGEVKRLAAELNRDYLLVALSVRTHRMRMEWDRAAVSSIPKCPDMIHSGKSFATLMARLLTEPMPGPNHGQP